MRYARIASLPERERSLEHAVKSIRPQVDSIFVVLNGYDHVPSFLNEGEYMMGDNSNGSAMKFIGVDDLDGYVFILDDDLCVPHSYVKIMTEKIHQYNAVVTLHGKTYPRPPKGFLQWKEVHRCLGNVPKDAKVDVPGTGILAYHTDIVKVKYSDFPTPNMTDLWMAKICYDQNVPVWVVAHDRHYLRYFPYKDTLWRRESKNGFIHRTELLQSFLK